MDQYPYYSGHPAQQPPFSLYGLPTPNQNTQGDDIPGQESFNPLNYQQFEQSFHPNARQLGGLPQSPPDSYTKHSASESSDPLGGGHYPGSIEGRDDLLADPSLIRSSSEEKEKEGLGVPAQSKRKAQNRAAQRAFRERKERHVRDLEEKVSHLQQESTTILADNDRLKRELARYSTENEILRATTTSTTTASGDGSNRTHDPTTTGPMTYSPTDFYSDLVPEGQSARLHRVAYCKTTGERLLDAGAAWDLIQGHELFKRGLVDIAGVTRRLKKVTQCDGLGPAFRESHVQQAIEESAAGDCDELI
ncbi:hypothetical protein BDW59DRAFT_153043 [Aspergillus cavernicola]|uniref:BZIP domain-containing protein n=1 Tax=Aspergillus cavernicola TaxID=176166 RepID=A0ABR4HPV9_9EURO